MPGLSAAELAHTVRDASREDTSLDASGILWLEHINMEVDNRELALIFYRDFLGFVEDPSPSFHLNLGSQQLHLGVAAEAHPAHPESSRTHHCQQAHASPCGTGASSH